MAKKTNLTDDERAASMPFLPARAKLWIGSLDDPDCHVQAQYNPKELQIDKEVPWQDHKARNNRSGADRKDSSEQADLEFNAAATRTTSVELLFDGYENNQSVEDKVKILEKLSSPEDPESNKEPKERRPHHCVVAWGSTAEGMRPFRCVITSLSVKYTMWNSVGVPLRATCTIKLKEAERMDAAPATAAEYMNQSRNAAWEAELSRREEARNNQIQRASASLTAKPQRPPPPAVKTPEERRAAYRERAYGGLSPTEAKNKKEARAEKARAKDPRTWTPEDMEDMS